MSTDGPKSAADQNVAIGYNRNDIARYGINLSQDRPAWLWLVTNASSFIDRLAMQAVVQTSNAEALATKSNWHGLHFLAVCLALHQSATVAT